MLGGGEAASAACSACSRDSARFSLQWQKRLPSPAQLLTAETMAASASTSRVGSGVSTSWFHSVVFPNYVII